MSDPADSETKKLGDEPLFGATPPPTETSTSALPAQPSSVDATPADPSTETINPLSGATPPADAAVVTGAKERIEQGSRERVESLRRARAAELGRTSQSSTPPPFSRLTSAPKPAPSQRPSTLIPYLRRLSFVLSLLLGAGASIALIWSAFLLPRLHASFSARRALVDQQVERTESFLGRLRAVRAMGMHAGYKREILPSESSTLAEEEKGKSSREERGAEKGKGRAVAGEDESKAMIRELSSSAHSSTTSQDGDDSNDSITVAQPLIPDLEPLLVSLKSLSSTRGNTSTTRTSLLSTIESYTSALHRQLWNPRPGAGFGVGAGGNKGWGTGYGLNTLDQSLRNASGGGGGGGSSGGAGVYKDGWEGEGLSDRSEEWDKVRKEVRGIKGMLLGRRSMGMGA